MAGQQQYPDLDSDDITMPGTVDRNEETVRKGFWSKLQRNLARVPDGRPGRGCLLCCV